MLNGEGQELTQEEFQAALQHLDGLVQAFEQLPLQRVQEQAFAMLQAVDLVHRAALQRLVARLREEEGDALLERLADDPVVHTLLLLYDLAPEGQPWDEQGPGAAEEATPPAAGPAGAAAENVIRLNQVRVNDSEPSAPGDLRQPRFKSVAAVEELPPGTMQPAALGEARAMVVNVDGELYAVGEVCPGSQLSLLFGELEGPIVTCSWHGERYDVRSGRCVEAAGRTDQPRLPVYPLRVVQGEIQIALSPAGNGKAGPA